jgi:ferrous iron transport protein B
MKEKYTVALAGNPNCGKTTLFNYLTGSKQKVGNWPGVTVDKKEGEWKRHPNYKLLDLPGTYSLSPYSAEEKIAHDFIVNERPSVVVDIIESPNLERNLYLALQIMETGVPTVLALNMSDEIEKRNEKIDVKALEAHFGVKVVPIVAKTGRGIDELFEVINETIQNSIKPKRLSLYNQLKKLDDEGQANARYDEISNIVSQVYKKNVEINKENTKSNKIDKYLTSKVLGIPIFALIMYVLFQFSLSENLFGLGIPGLGILIAGWVEFIWEILTNLMATLVSGASPWAYGLVIDGVMGGIGAVLGFMPLVLVLYMFLTILEDSGYMSRVAFVLDRIFRHFGLSGKSFIPLLMGFGCSVPAIMATRTLDEEKDRHITTIITAFIPCGAKLPIIALFVAILFSPEQTANITFLIYAITFVTAILVSLILNKVLYKGRKSNFLMELPQYRFPTVRSIWDHAFEKVKGFGKKAGSIILVSTILIWFLTNFNTASFTGQNKIANNGESVMSEMDDSYMASFGNAISPIFEPLGFSGWRPTVGIITGWIAKENVVATFAQVYKEDLSEDYLREYFGSDETELEEAGFENGIFDLETANALYGDVLAEGGDANGLPSVRRDMPTKSGGFAYIMFNLLCMPCFAAVGAMKRELKTWKRTLGGVGIQMLTAYIIAFAIRVIGLIFGF